MKVYIVYKSNNVYDEVRRVFSNKDIARKYVDSMNEKTDYSWFFQEMGVSE